MEKVKDLFVETKKVLEDYKKQAEAINQQEQELKQELSILHSEMEAIYLDLETADLSEKIYLKMKVKEITNKAEIIETILEELNEERTALKLKYTPVLKESLAQDRKGHGEYNATEIVEKYKYIMLAEIAELGKAMQKQYHSIAPEVMEIFEDSTVKEHFPRLYYAFYQEQYTPSLQWANEAVVHKNEIFLAKDGRLPENLKQPKDVNK